MAICLLVLVSAIACVLAVAIIGKVRSKAAFGEFAASVAQLRVVPLPYSRLVAGGVLTLEVTGLALLLVPGETVFGLGVGAITLLAFSLVVALEVLSGTHVPCRCFGADDAVLSVRHLVRDISLTLLALGGLALWAGGVRLPSDISPRSFTPVIAGIVLGFLITRTDDIVYLVRTPATELPARGAWQ
jgi:Methylamine utilisation protein MauE